MEIWIFPVDCYISIWDDVHMYTCLAPYFLGGNALMMIMLWYGVLAWLGDGMLVIVEIVVVLLKFSQIIIF